MAPLCCPVDGFLLGFGAVEFAIGVVFDDVVRDWISVAAFGSRFDIDVCHFAGFSFLGTGQTDLRIPGPGPASRRATSLRSALGVPAELLGLFVRL